MNKPAFGYVFGLAAATLALLASLPRDALTSVGAEQVVGAAVFVGLGILSEVLALEVSVSAPRQASSSILFIPLFACILLFPPAIACVVVAVVVLYANISARRAWWLTLFNVSQLIFSYAIAAIVYHSVAGLVPFGQRFDLLAFAALAATFFASNSVCVAGFLATRHRASFVRLLRQIAGPAGGNLVYDLLASPVALGVAYLYERLHAGGLIATVLPLLLLRHSYSSKLKLEQVNKDLLKVLIKAIETRDPYTSGHSLRVSTLARIIAEDMGMSRRQVERVETAALLHDIGKIDALYAELIMKPHDLTPDEREIIRTHATKGAELLKSLSAFDDDIIKAVRHHHERYDGKGYPDGLAGKEIPLPSRIIMLCDSVDAMLSDRPYRPARTVEFTEEEVKRCAGSQFDPAIVEVMLARGTLRRAIQLLKDEQSDLNLVNV
ncbi:MAG: HD-GYP domain-containing protein [Gemmatimonadetes bacterium]|nr:HD-GYP domain-containing protein [Gemmatimonadota bacterium]